MLRVAFKSLGCRVNFAEIECLRGQFVDAGWLAVPFEETADVYVINTCTVTGLADAESRKVVRRAVRKKSAGGIVAVTGCYAQRDAEALRGLDGVDLVLGNVEKVELLEHVDNLLRDRRIAGDIWVSETPQTRRFLRHGDPGARQSTLRTRATLKIQDGCDEGCTYCIIPAVRGPSVSRDPAEIAAEARHLAGRGHREIALTGVHTGSFGHDRGEREGLARLVRALDRLGLRVRFRLNSLEPATVTDALLAAVADSPSFARHFHVPLQHGDSRILRRMGRPYDASFYRETILRIHQRFPDAGIGADVMVGFPGETESHFDASRALVASLPLSYLHVFTYSPRAGTPATRMPGHVEAARKRERSRVMHALEDELRASFIESLAGTQQVVLVEDKRADGRATGLTGNYVRLELAGNTARSNEFWRVRTERGPSPKLGHGVPLERVEDEECPANGNSRANGTVPG